MSNTPTQLTELLQPELTRVRDRLSGIDGWTEIADRDAAVAARLDRVIMCSDYVADAIARYPDDFDELLRSGRMHRSLEDGEYTKPMISEYSMLTITKSITMSLNQRKN